MCNPGKVFVGANRFETNPQLICDEQLQAVECPDRPSLNKSVYPGTDMLANSLERIAFPGRVECGG
jgi:hypothetical protein